MILSAYANVSCPHVDDELMVAFRMGVCELCCDPYCRPVHGHHLWGRGQRSCTRLDLPITLIAVGIACHNAIHAGNVPREHLLEIVAKRCRLSIEDIIDTVDWLRIPTHRRPQL